MKRRPRPPLAIAAVAVATLAAIGAFVATASMIVGVGGCSVLTDLGGLSTNDDTTRPDARFDAGPGPADARVEGPGTYDGGATRPDSGSTTPACDRVKLTVIGCEDVQYFPAGGASTTATRAAQPEVIVFGQHNPNGARTVVTDERSEPHVLVLASHDATSWQVTARTPSALKGVFLSGYDVSSAMVPAGVPVVANAQGGAYAYEVPSPDADELFAYARQVTGASAVTAFGGCHDGVEIRIEDGCP